mgnify:CR=1 FL=1
MIGNNGRATKHYFVGSERSTSRLAGDPDNYDDDGNHLSTPALSTLTGRQTADLEYVFTSFNLGAVVIDNTAPPSGRGSQLANRLPKGKATEGTRPAFTMATGQLQTMDGLNDPVFQVLTLGSPAAISTATAQGGFEVLGFAAIKNFGDDAVKGGTKLLGTVQDNLLSAVENPKLRNIVNDLYRSGTKVGSGSSMDAFRLEQLTGGTVGGKTHAIKLLNYRTALQKVWSNRANLSAGDRQITKQLLGDIQNALSGH